MIRIISSVEHTTKIRLVIGCLVVEMTTSMFLDAVSARRPGDQEIDAGPSR